MCLKVFISCSIILLQVLLTLTEIEERIFGGVSTTIREAPFLVQIYWFNKLRCSGTLVTSQHVVTAAHCTDGGYTQFLEVVGGATYHREPGVRSAVEKVYTPLDYNLNVEYHNDVAVLKLARPLVGPLIQSAGTCTQDLQAGDDVQIFGWGMTNFFDARTSYQLQTAKVKVVDLNQCADMYSGRAFLTESMFCALGDGQDACLGDSGGPAIVNGEFCGIISWGFSCADPKSPGVYVNVKRVHNFIVSALLL